MQTITKQNIGQFYMGLARRIRKQGRLRSVARKFHVVPRVFNVARAFQRRVQLAALLRTWSDSKAAQR